MRGFIRRLLLRRARNRISRTINNYTKSYYPDFEFSKPVGGEEEHLKKWADFLPRLDPLYYRLYSTISGVKTPDYLPDDVYVIFILSLLNDRDRDHVFRDKNFYDLIFPKNIFPVSLIRNIKAVYSDIDYKLIDDVNKKIIELEEEELIVKPSTNTSSGKNVRLFKRDDNNYYETKTGNILNEKYLNEIYKENFIVQSRLKQSEFFNKFNPTSINTIRIYTYRSVKDNRIHTLTNSIRVGGVDSITDNLNSGGYGIGVQKNGQLFTVAIDKYARKKDVVGDINLKKENFVPNFDEYLNFAVEIAEKFIYDRFLGLDIFRDEKGLMRIMEVNLGHIGTDLPHLIGTPMFGDFTDEIIDYCHTNKHKLDRNFTFKI